MAAAARRISHCNHFIPGPGVSLFISLGHLVHTGTIGVMEFMSIGVEDVICTSGNWIRRLQLSSRSSLLRVLGGGLLGAIRANRTKGIDIGIPTHSERYRLTVCLLYTSDAADDANWG